MLHFFVTLLIAMGLGLVIGLERTYSHKTAGVRTYALVTMSCALLVLMGGSLLDSYGPVSVDVTRIIAAIVSGIGFLGAGLIIFQDNHITNLTTAAGIWMAAAIGIAVGLGMVTEALIATGLTLFVLHVLAYGEMIIRKHMTKNNQ
jgi:putative Mg2+ transporter-C (MgtC) family protein